MPSAGQAQSDCTPQAKTQLERLFCKIQMTSEGRALPSFSDFRKNSQKVQAALLKTPARRLSLSVPAVENNQPNKRALLPSRNNSVSASSSKKSNNVSTSQMNNRETASAGDLQGCSLREKLIRCKGDKYYLSSNDPNKNLRSQALSESNKMHMKHFGGNSKNSSEVKDYLFDAYLQYIIKMLDIGLGASTMSFTKFYYTFYDLQDKNQNFSERFEKMYGFLKKDKASMAIKSRYTDAVPSNISQCSMLSREIVVCDQKEMNWVFVKK